MPAPGAKSRISRILSKRSAGNFLVDVVQEIINLKVVSQHRVPLVKVLQVGLELLQERCEAEVERLHDLLVWLDLSLASELL